MPAPTQILLAPGASGGVERLGPIIRGLAGRDVTARGVALPRGSAERALPAYRTALNATPNAVIGGHSFGGRVASMLAAEVPVRGLVLLSYPLHLPGRTAMSEERTAHWSQIECPVLLLAGERDPRADMGLLRRAIRRLPHAELVTYPEVGHGIGPVLDDAIERIAAFMRELAR